MLKGQYVEVRSHFLSFVFCAIGNIYAHSWINEISMMLLLIIQSFLKLQTVNLIYFRILFVKEFTEKKKIHRQPRWLS